MWHRHEGRAIRDSGWGHRRPGHDALRQCHSRATWSGGGHGGGGHGFHGGHGWEAMASTAARLGRPWLSRRARLGRRRGHHRVGPYWDHTGAVWVSVCLSYAYPMPTLYVSPRLCPTLTAVVDPAALITTSCTTVTIHRATTPMSNSVRWLENGGPEPTIDAPRRLTPTGLATVLLLKLNAPSASCSARVDRPRTLSVEAATLP